MNSEPLGFLHRAALRHRRVEMIRRVFEVDPLVCPRCGGEIGPQPVPVFAMTH